MITIREAREVLQDDTISDKEVEEIISFMQLLVELIYDTWLKGQSNEKNKSLQKI